MAEQEVENKKKRDRGKDRSVPTFSLVIQYNPVFVPLFIGPSSHTLNQTNFQPSDVKYKVRIWHCRYCMAIVSYWSLFCGGKNDVAEAADDGGAGGGGNDDDMVHSAKMGGALKILERMVNQNAEDEIFQDFKYWEVISTRISLSR